MTISSLPTPPNRAHSPEAFSDAADALLGALPTFVSEANALVTEVNGVLDAAETARDDALVHETNAGNSATLAQSQVGLAAAQATAASGSATTAGNYANSAQVAAAAAQAAAGLPSLTGKAKKALVVKSDETGVEWAAAGGIYNVVTATTSTTLTNTPTSLQITPAAQGVQVTLPDATTIASLGAFAVVENPSAYFVTLRNTAGTLLGFVPPRGAVNVTLLDKATTAGTWSLSGHMVVGVSDALYIGQDLYFSMTRSVVLDADRELLLVGVNSASFAGIVYNNTTRQFGSLTTIRVASVTGSFVTGLLADGRVVVVSATGTALEAVILTITGTTISVGTAASKTLPANLAGFTNVAFEAMSVAVVGTSVVCSYVTASLGTNLLAINAATATPSIGSEVSITGSVSRGGGIIVTATGVLAFYTLSGATHIYARHYAVSGNNLSPGTEVPVAAGLTINAMLPFALGSRVGVVVYDSSTVGIRGFIVSLSGTTPVFSTGVSLSTNGTSTSTFVLGGRVAVLGSSGAFNLLTDNAGAAVAGTAVGMTGSSSFAIARIDGTDVYVTGGNAGTNTYYYKVNCAANSPVLTLFGYRPIPVDTSSMFTSATHGVSSYTLSAGGRATSVIYAYERPMQMAYPTTLDLPPNPFEKQGEPVKGPYVIGRDTSTRWGISPAFTSIYKWEMAA